MAIKRGFAGLNEINNRVDTTSNFSNSINELADKVIFARVTDIILDNKHPKFIQYGQWNGLGTIEFEFVNSITSLSIPIPSPAVGGIPYSKALI